MMERVHEAFAGNYFDLTHVRNAMDHSANPLQAMRSLLSVTKPGGKLLLHHARKEGSQQDFGGFHQWDFDANAAGNFVISDKHGTTMDVSMELQEIATVRTTIEGDTILATIRKTGSWTLPGTIVDSV